MSSKLVKISHIHCGVVDYKEAWELQRKIHQDVCDGRLEGALITLQHPPTLTLGKYASEDHFLVSPKVLREEGVEIVRIDRGGEITAHQPGQLTIYPILPISIMKLSPRVYVEHLQSAMIAFLQEWGVDAQTDPDYPGVWVASQKICAIGVRIRSRVSMHGLALNVSNDLSLFHKIVPCGIQARGVTRLMDHTSSRSFDFEKLAQRFAYLLTQAIGGIDLSSCDELLAKNQGSSYYHSECAISHR